MSRSALFVAITACTSLYGCSSSTSYDPAWVTAELARTGGHAVPLRDAPATPGHYAGVLPPDVNDPHALSEDDAVSVALWNSASLRADLGQLGLSRADLADAEALPNPNFSFLFPVSTRQLELSAQYSISSLIQRPWRVAAAKLDVEKMARSLVQNGLDLIRDVRIAWAELEATHRRRALRVRVSEIVSQSADLVTSRFKSGDVSLLDADVLHAESLVAKELAGRTAHEEAIAQARLRMLLGVADSPLGVQVDVAPTEGVPATDGLDELEKVALSSRPDLRASELAVQAASERVGLEKSRIVQLFARLDAKPVGSRGGAPLLWLPGFTGDIPIFNQNPGGRARAAAELERSAWTYCVTRQQVLTDVRVAYEEITMAEQSRAPYRALIVPLQEKNTLAARKAYEAGGESYLVVLDATRRLLDANVRELELELDLRRARARLDRAVGWRIRAHK